MKKHFFAVEVKGTNEGHPIVVNGAFLFDGKLNFSSMHAEQRRNVLLKIKMVHFLHLVLMCIVCRTSASALMKISRMNHVLQYDDMDVSIQNQFVAILFHVRKFPTWIKIGHCNFQSQDLRSFCREICPNYVVDSIKQQQILRPQDDR